MRIKVCLIAGLLSAAVLSGQSQNPPQEAELLKPRAYVRRVSAGATLSVRFLRAFPERTTNTFVSFPKAIDSLYSTTEAAQRIGYGITTQLLITDQFAVNASLLMRRPGYIREIDVIEGVDNPNTPEDDRKHIIRHEDTRARFYELPVVVRYYTKDRYRRGARFFLEGGAALRKVSNIRTSIYEQVGSGDKTCCDTTPASYAQRTIRGFVGGMGVQLIDELGLRIVPEVRYTYWTGRTFDALSVVTQRNQIEAMISITF